MGADEIFDDVMTALQPAEDIGGPSPEDYVALMDRVIKEATERKQNCIEQFKL